MTNGIISNWTRAQYDADESRVRSTCLKDIVTDQGPRLYYRKHITKELAQLRKPADHFEFGHLFHEFVLEGKKNWWVYDGRRAGKAYEEARLDNGLLPDLKPHEEAQLLAMRESVMANKEARRLIVGGGFSEQTFLWTDDETGLDCKCRVDLYGHDGTIVDLKSTREADPKGFFYQCSKLKYHFSAAFYEQGRNAALGKMIAPFKHIVVDKNPPYWCYVRPLSEYAMTIGHRDVRKALAVLRKCLDRQQKLEMAVSEWPGSRPTREAIAECWPDWLEKTQDEAYTPNDYWLAENEYGLAETDLGWK